MKRLFWWSHIAGIKFPIRLGIALLLGLSFLLPVKAQIFHSAETSYALKLGRTRPLYEVAPIAPTDSLKLKKRKENKPTFVPNFAGRRHLEFHAPDALPKGKDPLFNPDQLRMPPVEIQPSLVFEGISEADANSGVPDVNGDVGRDYYVEVVNATHFRVYNKNGAPVSNIISANTIWAQVGHFSAGDPILLYDQEADRWFLTEFPSSNRVLLAISVTNDPRGSWDAYAFQTPRFPDFPKYGIWPDAYYLTTNEGGPNFPVYAFNREDILAGADTVRFQRLTVPKHGGVFFEVGQPVDWDGMQRPPDGSPAVVVKLNDDDWFTTSQDHIILHKIHIDWDTASNSFIALEEIPTAPFDTDGCSFEHTGGFSCVPQPNGQGIDGAQWIITNKAQYRNFGSHESFVMSFMVDVTGDDVAGIRWMEFRKSPVEDWHLFQEGTVGSDDGLHRFMSSIGIDGQGNIGLAYSVSGMDKHPSLRFTGRYSSDPPGTMTFEEFEFASGNGSLGFDRFGDYACMSVDPADDKSFWFAGEYIPTNNNWSTKIVVFNASKDTFDIFPLSLVEPSNSPHLDQNEPLTISILNRGLETVYNFQVEYQFMDEAWILEDALLDSLKPDSIYRHTFQTGLNFGAPGNYDLRVASRLNGDGNLRNDTLSFVITKQAFRDLALQLEGNGNNNVVCSSSHDNSFVVRNLGADTVLSASFEIIVNITSVDTFYWVGNLLPGEEIPLSFHVDDLVEGNNQLSVNILDLNGDPDEIPSNNLIEWELTANPTGEAVILQLLTDNFPQETSWELVDSMDQVIMSAGPFTDQQQLYTTEFCLDPEACYAFTIYDAFGDGMSAQGVTGHYDILNGDGVIIASLAKPNFGLSNTNEFCLTSDCMLELSAAVMAESSSGAADGWIMAEVANSLGQLSFSINGGMSFQSSNIFQNLPSGNYELIAIDGAGCSDTLSVTLEECMLEAVISTLPAAGGDVGEIHIHVTGGAPPYMYSLNGSAFTSDSFFVMLEPGDYVVTIKDAQGCERTDSVNVSTHVSTSTAGSLPFIRVFPNPGKGAYQVDAVLNIPDIFLDYRVYTQEGEFVSFGTLAKYDDHHKGEILLVAYPNGMYYAVFYLSDKVVVKRLIKTE